MAKIYVCDRCGSLYPKNAIHDPLRRTDHNMVGVGAVTTKRYVYTTYLCDKCLEDFYHWLYEGHDMDLTNLYERINPEDIRKDIPAKSIKLNSKVKIIRSIKKVPDFDGGDGV